MAEAGVQVTVDGEAEAVVVVVGEAEEEVEEVGEEVGLREALSVLFLQETSAATSGRMEVALAPSAVALLIKLPREWLSPLCSQSTLPISTEATFPLPPMLAKI